MKYIYRFVEKSESDFNRRTYSEESVKQFSTFGYEYFDSGKIYEHYDYDITKTKQLYDDVVRYVGRDHHSVLDVGCAKGSLVKYLNEKEIQTRGIDISEYAVQNRFHANVSCGDIFSFEFSHKEFDLAISNGVIYLVPEPGNRYKTLCEMNRISRKSYIVLNAFFDHSKTGYDPMIQWEPFITNPTGVNQWVEWMNALNMDGICIFNIISKI
jgi:2-polyprenyl-3-methyl-5-hydroxy-6-metoxy-1,4-benzoquinol methylase